MLTFAKINHLKINSRPEHKKIRRERKNLTNK